MLQRIGATLRIGLVAVSLLGLALAVFVYWFPPRSASGDLASAGGVPVALYTLATAGAVLLARFWYQHRREVLLAFASVFAAGIGFDIIARWIELPAGLPTLPSMGLTSRWLYRDVVSRYQPQLVLYPLDATDIGDDWRYASEASFEDGRPIFERWRQDVSSFRYYGPVWQLTQPLRVAFALPFEGALGPLGPTRDAPYEYYRFNLEFGRKREKNLYFIYRHPLASTRPYFKRTLDNIHALAAEVTSSGARLALVVAPRFHHWNPEECPDNWESSLYALDEPYQYEYFRFFREARERVGFPIYDLLPDFRATDEFPLVFRWDPHWNERGHALVAASVSRFTLSSRLLEVPRAEPGP